MIMESHRKHSLRLIILFQPDSQTIEAQSVEEIGNICIQTRQIMLPEKNPIKYGMSCDMNVLMRQQ